MHFAARGGVVGLHPVHDAGVVPEDQVAHAPLVAVDTRRGSGTLEEVGQAFNVTRERIRQIENQSLKKLQSLAEAQKLRDVA